MHVAAKTTNRHTHTRETTTVTTIIITSAIQRINGASLKEHWAAQRNQVYKQQYQRLQHDTDLKYKNGIFLKLSTVMIAQRSSVYCTEIYIILLDKSAVWKVVSWARRIYYVFITLIGARGREKYVRCISRTFREH